MAGFAGQYIITVAHGGAWNRRCTARALVQQIGIPPVIAARWATVRRSMNPAGLKRALRDRGN